MSAQLSLWDPSGPSPDPGASVTLSIRESRRARQLILQTLPPRTIEVVVPRGARPGAVESFIREHRDWIDRAGRELVAAYPRPDYRPRCVELAAIGSSVAIHYRDAREGRARYRYDPGRLQLFCAAADHSDAPTLLRRWLIREGRARLEP